VPTTQVVQRGVRSSHAAIMLLLAQPALAAEPSDVWSTIDTKRVCPTALVWRLGIGPGRTPFDVVETVVPLEVNGRPVWRITHTQLRGPEDLRNGTTPGFDFFDLDRATLAPLQSEHRTAGRADAPARTTRFEYLPDSVRRLNKDGTVAETIALAAGQRLIADGPGAGVINQAVNWSDGLKLRAYMLDRWRGTERERLREVELSVIGRSAVEIGGRRVETFVVVEEPVDRSYKLTSQVTVARPHLPVRVEYVANAKRPDARAFVSEVTSIMSGGSCEAAR
jgi:hypothetical protein